MNHIALHLKEIFFQKKTGKLTFKNGNATRHLFCQDGEIIQVKTNVDSERLGDILFKLHRIAEDEHSRIDEFIEPNVSLGEVLKDKGVISETDLEEALTYQVRESVLNCFSSFDAEISFLEREKFSDKSARTNVSVPFLIEYGIRRLPSSPELKTFLSARVPVKKNDTYAYILTPEEKLLLDRLNGREQAKSVQASSGMPEDAFWHSLFLFYCLDLIELALEDNPARPAPNNARPTAAPAARADKEIDPDLEEVLAFQEGLANKNHYQILGLSRAASQDDIKKSYFGLARRFHPDRFPRGLSKEKRAIVEDVFSAVTGAYRVLGTPDSRKVYDGQNEPGGEAVDTTKNAEIRYRQGKTLFNQGRYHDALTLLAEAVRMRRDKGDYFLLLAMVESKLPDNGLKAEEDFQKAISLEPWNPEAYVGLGLLYKREGLKIKATHQFKKALEVDPEHKIAREHYNELTGGEKKGLAGLFSFDLFGPKKKKK